MTEPLKTVSPGQPLVIPASTWNAFVEVAREQRAAKAGMSGRAQVEPQPTAADVVLVRNDSGADQGQFAVLGVSAPIILPSENEGEFRRRVALSCVTPQTGVHEGRFVVLLEPLGAGAIGRAAAAGVTPVRVNIDGQIEVTDHVDVTDSSAALVNQVWGSAQVLWRAGGAGLQWAVVRLDAIRSGGIWTINGIPPDAGYNFTFTSADETVTITPGEAALDLSAEGAIGPMPAHEWNGTELRFEIAVGEWGEWTDLEGPQGPQGPEGDIGPMPAHQWNGTELRFEIAVGQWGEWVDLQGPPGEPDWSIIDAKGDLIVGAADDTPARLPAGNVGEIVVVVDAGGGTKDLAYTADYIKASLATAANQVLVSTGEGAWAAVPPVAGVFVFDGTDGVHWEQGTTHDALFAWNHTNGTPYWLEADSGDLPYFSGADIVLLSHPQTTGALLTSAYGGAPGTEALAWLDHPGQAVKTVLSTQTGCEWNWPRTRVIEGAIPAGTVSGEFWIRNSV